MVDVVKGTEQLRDLVETGNFRRGMRLLLLQVQDEHFARFLLQSNETEQTLQPDSPFCNLMEECFEHVESKGQLAVLEDCLIIDGSLVVDAVLAVLKVRYISDLIELGHEVMYDIDDLALACLFSFLVV
jgi:hypothetical protein